VIVLVLNCGSSSVKFRVTDAATDRAPALAGGAVERLGAAATVTLERAGTPAQRSVAPIADHDAAVRHVVAWVTRTAGLPAIEAVGHRVVHGGERFTAPAIVDDGVLGALESLGPLAPLHNGPSLAGIRASRAVLGPAVPTVVAFDTAFHAALPAAAAGYAIPETLARRHGIRRFGFHGLAYRSVLAAWAAASGVRAESARLVALHLGSGCSAAAIEHGRSVETSMGFTPLEGLVMGTRSGDVDPALVDHLAACEGVAAAEVVRWLNERSGLLGVSGTSADMRDLLGRAPTDAAARLAVEMFCHRARKYLGAYLAVLGGADAVLFSGGIGEHQAPIRERICEGFEWCGLVLDPARDAARGGPRLISAAGARIAAWVVPADEESAIAADTVACLARAGCAA
jgi:acetate kinase